MRYEKQLLHFIHRESMTGVTGVSDSDRNVGKGGHRRSAGQSSSSLLHSPQCHPVLEEETFSGDARERRSGECASDMAIFLKEEPAEHHVRPMAKTSTSHVPPQTVEPEKDGSHRSLIRHHKSLMKKMDTLHVDFCVATNAYNESQARQAVYEAAMLSLHQEHLKVQLKKRLIVGKSKCTHGKINFIARDNSTKGY